MTELIQWLDAAGAQLFDHVQTHGPVVAAAFVACLLLRFVPWFRTPVGLAALGASAALRYGPAPAEALWAVAIDLSSLFVVAGLAYAWTNAGTRLGGEAPGREAFRWRWALVGIAALVAAFSALRIWPNLARSDGLALAIDMFMLLRLASFLWEYGTGRVPSPGVVPFAAWCLFPAIRFGPVMRYSDFCRQLPLAATRPLDRRWARLVAEGLLKIAAVAAITATHALPLPPWLAMAFGILFVNPWTFYLLHAGLADLFVAAGWLGGLVVPINYDRPFAATNLGDFWARWHMSATTIFRETLFFQRWGLERPNLMLNALIVFTLVGAWHDFNSFWILWGLLHGLGYCGFIAWRKFQQRGGPRLPAWAGWAITYLFVCGCWAAPPQIVKAFAIAAGRLGIVN